MYRINKESNSITQLKRCSFSELGFRERAHLQEWIANEPSALGEELLIIQKEFAGFSDTQERPDLLALDKQGSLIVIENKLDDSGRDVTWQALKYASYCASLSKDGIRQIFQEYLDRSGRQESAEELLCDFYGAADFSELSLNKGTTQRIVLIAANFRKEVTSTVLWLLNFRLRLQCFKATPFALGDDLFLNLEQIIPLPDTEEFMIGFADKAQDEVAVAETEKQRHGIRRRFWTQVFQALGSRTDLYQNVTPPAQSWTSAGSGIRGVGFVLVATRDSARVELYIDRGSKDENLTVYEFLYERKTSIEDAFGGDLIWEPLENRRACRVKVEEDGNIFDEDEWPQMTHFLVDALVRMERAIRPVLSELGQRLRGEGVVA